MLVEEYKIRANGSTKTNRSFLKDNHWYFSNRENIYTSVDIDQESEKVEKTRADIIVLIFAVLIFIVLIFVFKDSKFLYLAFVIFSFFSIFEIFKIVKTETLPEKSFKNQQIIFKKNHLGIRENPESASIFIKYENIIFYKPIWQENIYFVKKNKIQKYEMKNPEQPKHILIKYFDETDKKTKTCILKTGSMFSKNYIKNSQIGMVNIKTFREKLYTKTLKNIKI